MSNKDLKNKPHLLEQHTQHGSWWWYETRNGFEIYTVKSGSSRISWRQIRAALKRKDKKEQP